METLKRDLSKELFSELECPVCKEYMLPPIWLCENGHSICSKCKPKLTKCPTCTKPLLKIRNLTLENLARKVEYPCTNRKYGCKVTHSVDDIIDHQSTCVYAPVTCPFSREGECSFADIPRNLKKHLLECHSRNVRKENAGTHFKINPDSYELKGSKVMFEHDEIFYMHIQRRAYTYYIVVTYVGKPEKASKYAYKISFIKPNSVESITVCQVSRSDTEDLNEILESGNCFNLPCYLLKHYKQDDGHLLYKLEIFEV